MDRLTAMRTFVTVVQQGSFTAAARALAIQKTRVSQRIQELEAALNTRLLHRTTRSVAPTDEGHRYFDACRKILSDIDAVEQGIAEGAIRPQGNLRVTCMSLVARSLILPNLADFHHANPDVTVSLSVSDRLMNIGDSGFDCAIRGGALDNSSLVSRRIGLAEFGLYASAAWQKRNGSPAKPSDLEGLDLIRTVDQREGGMRAWELLGPKGSVTVATAAWLETDREESALDAALSGAGIMLCPHFAASSYLAENRLIRILPRWTGRSRPIYMIFPTRKYVPPRLRVFMDWIGHIVRSAGL